MIVYGVSDRSFLGHLFRHRCYVMYQLLAHIVYPPLSRSRSRRVSLSKVHVKPKVKHFCPTAQAARGVQRYMEAGLRAQGLGVRVESYLNRVRETITRPMILYIHNRLLFPSSPDTPNL